MFYRKRGLLLLFKTLGPEINKLDFQSYLFLWTKELSKPFYDFVSFQKRAFSFQAERDLETLKNLKLFTETKTKWILKKRLNLKELKKGFKTKDLKFLSFIKSKYRFKKGDKLLKAVFLKDPYYAFYSKKSKNPRLKKERNEVLSYPKLSNEKILFTIGYEGKSIDSYLNLLFQNGVKVLCDVRKTSVSRKYGFSKSRLKELCGKLNIEYRALNNLGVKLELRKKYKPIGDLKGLFKVYRSTVLKTEKESINVLRELLNKKKRIALACVEKEHTSCHRHCLSDFIEKKEKEGLKVVAL